MKEQTLIRIEIDERIHRLWLVLGFLSIGGMVASMHYEQWTLAVLFLLLMAVAIIFSVMAIN